MGKFIELPYTMPQDHTLFYIFKHKNINIWKKKAQWISQNKGVILTLTRPDYLQEQNNLLYRELLEYLKGIKNSWHCLPKQLAYYWQSMKYDQNVN